MRARPIGMSLALGLAVFAPGAGAAEPPSLTSNVTITGPAGSRATVHLPYTALVDRWNSSPGSVTADRGHLAAVGFVAAAAPEGRRPAFFALSEVAESWACPEGCPRGYRQDVAPGGAGQYVALPRGRYTVVLVGEPGSTVTARLSLAGLKRGTSAVRTDRPAVVRLSSMGALPQTGVHDPYTFDSREESGLGQLVLAGLAVRVQSEASAGFPWAGGCVTGQEPGGDEQAAICAHVPILGVGGGNPRVGRESALFGTADLVTGPAATVAYQVRYETGVGVSVDAYGWWASVG